MKTIKLLSNIMIDGQRVAAGSVVTVPTGVALDLLHRQRAEIAQEAEETTEKGEETFDAAFEVFEEPVVTVDAAPEPLETEAPRKNRRR